MHKIIKNYEALATTPLREDALTIAEAGLRSIDTVTVLENSVVLHDDLLIIQGRQFSLSDYENIYIIGFGKVACTAAHTLERMLSGRVHGGAVIGLAEKTCQVIDTYAGTHPLPSQLNYTATRHIEEVARCAKENDLVLVIVSGGGSALLCSSMGECDQGTKLFAKFLESGGTIEELNVVRKHISSLKGGGLAKSLYPATVVGLIFSDVPGGDMSAVASGPTCLDSTTVADAEAIINRYDLGKFYLIETPKETKYFERVYNINLLSNVTALNAMQSTARELGYRSQLVSATQYSTPDETKEMLKKKASTGSVQCLGGETKLNVPDNCRGKGGRNDYLALEMMDSIEEGQIFVSMASDGHDNTEAAGAIVDQHTFKKAQQINVSADDYKKCFNSFPFFDQVGDHIVTGLLESNVSDLMFLLTSKKESAPVPIDDISVKTISDSRGNPTVEVVVTAGKYQGTFSVPSGASTGSREVQVMPPDRAELIIQTIILPALRGVSVTDQLGIDARLKGVGRASLALIGGNIALGVSVAACKAAAKVKGVEVWEHIADLFGYQEQSVSPRLFVNLINGGEHADQGSPIQEHQIIPDTDDVIVGLEAAKKIQETLGELLQEFYAKEEITIGDEGGFVVPSNHIHEPFQHIADAIKRAELPVPILMGADMAASSFYKDGVYNLEGVAHDTESLLAVYKDIHEAFPLLQLVEDPCVEHDFAAFTRYHAAHPGVITIGDDLTTTNKESLKKAIVGNSISGIIIKPNQIGTVSDTLSTMNLAYENKIKCIVSHRSGETMDDFIADLAYGTKCYGLKAGAPSMPERAAKYDRLLKIRTS